MEMVTFGDVPKYLQDYDQDDQKKIGGDSQEFIEGDGQVKLKNLDTRIKVLAVGCFIMLALILISLTHGLLLGALAAHAGHLLPILHHGALTPAAQTALGVLKHSTLPCLFLGLGMMEMFSLMQKRREEKKWIEYDLSHEIEESDATRASAKEVVRQMHENFNRNLDNLLRLLRI